MDRLTIRGSSFVDTNGRSVLLRGVNLSGSTKTPPDEPTQIANTFSRHRAVSFVGRPFPRTEAHEHLERLRHWGFNVLRFLTTWEAIEHAGPSQYDAEYLDYLAEMVALAGDYGFYVFIDPHQDVWSRMTGGDGAPGWTLEAVGFDIARLDLSEAAITMQRRYPDYPRMVWPNNYNRLACLTMFTLFFAGSKYAPGVEIDGVPVQDFLQDAFIKAMQQVARRLKDMPHVLGYGPLNEPSSGFLGIDDLTQPHGNFPQQGFLVTPAEAILLGAGFSRDLPEVDASGGFLPTPTGRTVTANPLGISAWRGEDLWRRLGVGDIGPDGEPYIAKPDYFAGSDFLRDGLLPFIRRYAAALRAEHPGAIIFLESSPVEPLALTIAPGEFDPAVHAGHWYDALMLFSKSFNGEIALDMAGNQIVTGREAVAQQFKTDIARLRAVSENQLGGLPTLVGEFGLAYDINGASAYRDGDYSLHELALSLYYDAIDASLCHSTQWNYTPDNTNRWGDNWNEEDLSIFSRDQQDNPADIHSGGRAVKGFSRPYVQRAAGTLTHMRFDHASGAFTATVDVDPAVTAPTLIYVPDIWYPRGCAVTISSGAWAWEDRSAQPRIAWREAAPGPQTITLAPTQ
ncbi:MAG: cellulase family glycosylhydrolase [Aggregatilineales bacterium]